MMNAQEIKSPKTGQATAVLAVIEGLRFHVHEDAINEDRNLIDPEILRPMSRLGGITYGRLLEGIEIPRPDWDDLKQEVSINISNNFVLNMHSISTDTPPVNGRQSQLDWQNPKQKGNSSASRSYL